MVFFSSKTLPCFMAISYYDEENIDAEAMKEKGIIDGLIKL
jgi:hypothetical protein